ncbi:MAG: peptide chain release factor N(5)-glutamine methyltransferase [Ignavibacteria bacterium]|nr:peptide chain release factor N(5)-glutamine methyltransferase [Ignavibacteria bacterium]
MSETKLTNLLDILKYSAKILSEKGIEDARLNAELLMANILGCSRMELYLNFDKPLNEDERNRYKVFLKRRMKREPLQYILGETEFCSYKFIVNNKVLIPRPETELLTERTIKYILNEKLKVVRILDIGTGSGCITVALSGELTKNKVKHHITAVDISEDALKTAQNNAIINNTDTGAVFYELNDIFSDCFNLSGFDIIVSNPPYISKQEYEKLEPELRYYEPGISLTDSSDGLSFFKRIFKLIETSNQTLKCFLEIGYCQKETLEKMALNYNITDFIFHKDYNGIFRIMEITKCWQ